MVKQSQADALARERIRYRLTVLQRTLPLLPGAAIIVAGQILFWAEGGPAGPVLVTGLVLWLVAPLVAVVSSSAFGITLTTSAAVVHNFRRRVIPWSDVQAIRIEPLMGSRTVVLHEANGRRTRLRAPMTGFLSWDRRFEEKFHTIGRWWLDHRGPEWTPVPPPRTWWDGPTTAGDPYAPPA
ncbi:hypothetical protein NLX86_14660 [Streptomyces sp. A3M-1-3]|uniref:hypothetical protein n=1 Tax=Streptomyces sp. A3M-1-3 TaxID=2962044 RepID=UPI0020B73976|nr:hypothetical protein [Streptomyces sp. A3M-1-3]MCP3819298.1 hypothetical protein [Streptomyces sp. A3M-1-3]